VDLPALAERLKQHVAKLAAKPRTPGSRAHQSAAESIRAHMKRIGFSIRDAAFSEVGFEGVNLSTEPLPERTDLPLLIIGAHYDSVPGSPGADDNASAVAALLELAEAVKPLLDSKQVNARLQLAAYDLEEYGLVGSSIHAREVHRARMKLRGMISLEMLGYIDHRPGSQRLPSHLAHLYPDVGNFIGVCGNEASRELLQVVADAMKTIDGLPVECLAVPGNGEILPETRLSDHSSFWDRGYPALMITDTAFFRSPHYHQSSDTPDTLDYPFLARVTSGVIQAARRLLQG
jgi:Zn-dependent M28 family amino/carboxypeptidase